jgi:hypothetical protein
MTVDSHVRQSRRNRQTGTTVEVWDCRVSGSPVAAEPDNPWVTFCVDHGTFASHPTSTLARSHAAYPQVWCVLCQEAVSPPAR